MILAMDAKRNDLLTGFYEKMVLINTVESSLLNLFAEGLLRGTVHTCLGQEAIPTGVCAALEPGRDIVCSNHRGHGHFLAFGGEARPLIAEIMGDASGVCRGIGGSQHIQLGNFYSNGILGGMSPVATGMALAEKRKGSGGVVVQFLGDGALAEGVVSEAFNMAALWSLPILFAVESNGFAQSTPTALEHAGKLSARGAPYGIPITELDGNDVLAVHAAAQEAVGAARGAGGPQILFMNTYRLGPHSKGDDPRDPAEIARHAEQAPIPRARAGLDPEWCDTTDHRIAAEVAAIIQGIRSARIAAQ
ncbi:thiamine pyrophosphate-dependent dehydrogenase E1 component subunit alpha [Dongia sedimenti]|uniref:Thiamine pyrophosphate-dependent dehydrogenase E1 component subunit alpha n=1 Tax=Dongia sedimenti TaxID=3064282 RepID=A0ABU0YK91_9PROT|nr:thiamine pyrophosphate-dependent dehydrogenase E1 component subunit alpha [Rhodospirillaceae bacterium R-7]